MNNRENRLDFLGRQLSGYVTTLFAEHTGDALLYHNLDHTRLVVSRTLEIASFYRLDASKCFVLLAAAWFHDTGQLFSGPVGHELKSVSIMEEFMEGIGLPPTKTREIKACILATRIPHAPENLLQEIICDADTYNLGTEEFLSTDDLLKEELRLRGHEVGMGWDKATLDFLRTHRFFTSYCRGKLNMGKQRNIDLLRARIGDNGINSQSKPKNMKWTSEQYPLEMEELEPRTREKAIEIANRLKSEGSIKELSIVEEAIRQAKEWSLEMEG